MYISNSGSGAKLNRYSCFLIILQSDRQLIDNPLLLIQFTVVFHFDSS